MNDIIEKAISIKPRNEKEELERTIMRIHDLEKQTKELKFKIDMLTDTLNSLDKDK